MLRYLTDKKAKDADDLVMNAFTGAAAKNLRDPAKIRSRNLDIINKHFKLDRNNRLATSLEKAMA